MEQIMYRKTLDVHKNGVQFMLQGFETADNLSRVIEISLMASGDAIDFPLEKMVAMMYVTTPGATEPSINECTIKDNKVVYEVLPIVEEGITTMQLKLIETSPEGATSVLATPKFAVEVTKSDADDESAEQSTTFTALEVAVAKAESTYDARLLRVEIDEVCIFRAYYADGTVYETDELRKTLLQGATNLDLNTLIKDGIANFTADEVAVILDEKYKQLFSNARYVSNLLEDFAEATFVKWDAETENTPYKAGLTECTEGFAHVFGSVADNHTIVAWTMGGENLNYFTHNICSGTDNGWDSLLSKIDCLKTEIAEELHSINERISEESRLADERISKVETDGFHIGDIRHSLRNDLGDKYLLCNGDYLYSFDGYSKFTELNPVRYSSIPNEDGRAIRFYNGMFYQFCLIGSEIYLRIYNNYIELIHGDCSKEIHVYSGIESFEGLVIFKEKLFLSVKLNSRYHVIYAELDAIESGSATWTTFVSTSNAETNGGNKFYMRGTSEGLFVMSFYIANPTTGNYIRCNRYVYGFTADGKTFKSGVVDAPSIGGAVSVDYDLRGISFTNNMWFVYLYDTPSYNSNYGNLIIGCVHTNTMLATNDGGALNFSRCFYSGSIYTFRQVNIVYYNNYYWFSYCDNSNGHKIYRAETLSESQWKYFDSTTSANTAPYFFVWKSKLFRGGDTSKIYNETTDTFDSITSAMYKEYGFSNAASPPSCETDDLYVHGGGGATIAIVPKTFVIAQVPTISESYGYAYIKAKE